MEPITRRQFYVNAGRDVPPRTDRQGPYVGIELDSLVELGERVNRPVTHVYPVSLPGKFPENEIFQYRAEAFNNNIYFNKYGTTTPAKKIDTPHLVYHLHAKPQRLKHDITNAMHSAYCYKCVPFPNMAHTVTLTYYIFNFFALPVYTAPTDRTYYGFGVMFEDIADEPRNIINNIFQPISYNEYGGRMTELPYLDIHEIIPYWIKLDTINE